MTRNLFIPAFSALDVTKVDDAIDEDVATYDVTTLLHKLRLPMQGQRLRQTSL